MPFWLVRISMEIDFITHCHAVILLSKHHHHHQDTEVDRMPLYIQYSHESCPIIPPAYIIESILSLDMCVNYSLDTELNCFIISGDEISQWKSRNTLS
jgi:hypothetical protein